MSPISLLNDFAVAIHERNIFKDLKGDKKLLNLMRAKAYSSMTNNTTHTIMANEDMEDQEEIVVVVDEPVYKDE